MSRRVKSLVVGMVASIALGVSAVGTASAAVQEETGKYYYSCVLSSGYTYSLQPKEPTKNCKGSYLQQYINGRQVHVYSLTSAGTPATYKPTRGCILAVLGTGTAAAALVVDGTTPLGWFGLALASASLPDCKSS